MVQVVHSYRASRKRGPHKKEAVHKCLKSSTDLTIHMITSLEPLVTKLDVTFVCSRELVLSLFYAVFFIRLFLVYHRMLSFLAVIVRYIFLHVCLCVCLFVCRRRQQHVNAYVQTLLNTVTAYRSFTHSIRSLLIRHRLCLTVTLFKFANV